MSSEESIAKKKVSSKVAAQVGVYQLGDCIGKGAFGTVYRGLNTSTGEVVALKQFEVDRVGKDEVESLVSEIRILKDLHHPNIVRYIDFVKTERHLNIVLEYVEQGSLLSLVKQFGVIPENLISVYVAQTLQGLAYLHSKGVTHCDIKCGNILVTKMGELKLTDFGVSRTFTKAEAGSLTAEVVGTPYWMAPEVIELHGITPAADIWSLACTIIELITGHPPYHDMPSMAALFRIVQDPHPPLPESISDELAQFLTACFHKDPKSRPAATELSTHAFIRKFAVKSTQDGAQPTQRGDVEKDLLDLPRLLQSQKTTSAHKHRAAHKHHSRVSSSSGKHTPGMPSRSTTQQQIMIDYNPDAEDAEEQSSSAADDLAMAAGKLILADTAKQVRSYQFSGSAGILDTISANPTESELLQLFAVMNNNGSVSVQDAKILLCALGYDAKDSQLGQICRELKLKDTLSLQDFTALHAAFVKRTVKMTRAAVQAAFTDLGQLNPSYLRKVLAVGPERLSEKELQGVHDDDLLQNIPAWMDTLKI